MQQIAKKVTLEGEVIVDLSSTTLLAAEAKAGKYFYDANGNKTLGTYTVPIDTNNTFTAGTNQIIKNAATDTYFSSVKINPTPTEIKVVSPSNESQDILPQSNYHLSKVTINPIQIDTANEVTAGTSQIIKNAEEGKYFSSIIIKPTPTEEREITPTTEVQTINPEGKYLSKVTVKAIETEEKEIIPATSDTLVTPSTGKYLSKITVKAIETEEKEIVPTTAAVSVQPTTGHFLSKVTVKPLQTKTINNFLKNQTITADEGYCGLKSVSIAGTQQEFDAINAIIGEGI